MGAPSTPGQSETIYLKTWIDSVDHHRRNPIDHTPDIRDSSETIDIHESLKLIGGPAKRLGAEAIHNQNLNHGCIGQHRSMLRQRNRFTGAENASLSEVATCVWQRYSNCCSRWWSPNQSLWRRPSDTLRVAIAIGTRNRQSAPKAKARLE